MSYAVRLHWEGRRWEFRDVEVEVQTGGDLLAVPARYTPRRFTVRLPLGDLRSLIVSGASPATATCEVTYNGQLLLGAPPVSIEAGHRGHLATIVAEERPIRGGNMLPPEHDVRVVTFNADETRKREDLLEDYLAWQYEWLAAPPWNKPMLTFSEVGQRLEEAGFNPAVPVYAGTNTAASQFTTNQRFADTLMDRIELQTFDPTVYDDRVEGLVYPLVFGQPGIDGTPALRPHPIDATASDFIVAGHHMTPGTATIYKRHNGETVGYAPGAVSVTRGQDDLGRKVSFLRGITGNDDGPGGAFYDGAADYAMALDGTAAGLSSDAADVVAYLTAQVSGLRLNQSATRVLAGALRGWKLDGVIDAQVDPWDVLTRDILPLLPVAIVAGPTGVDFVPLRLEATAGDADRRITAGRDFAAASTVYTRDGRALNASRVVMRHAFNAFSNAPSRSEAALARTNEVARRAGALTGQAVEVSTPWIYDRATAQRAAQLRLLREIKSRLSVEYQANPYRYGIESPQPLEIGDIVALTDSAMSLSNRPAMVVKKVRRNRSDLRFTLALL